MHIEVQHEFCYHFGDQLRHIQQPRRPQLHFYRLVADPGVLLRVAFSLTEPPTERASMHKAFRRIQHFEQFYFCVHRACQCVCFAFPTLTQFEHSKLRWILSEGLLAQRLQRCHGRKMKGSWQMTRLGNLLLASACILHLLLSVWLHCWIVLWLYFRRERFGNGTCDGTALRLQTKRSQGSFRAFGKAVPRLWHWEGS